MVSVYLPGMGDTLEECEEIKKLFQKSKKPFEIIDLGEVFESGRPALEAVFSRLNRIAYKTGKIDCLMGCSLGGSIAIEYALKNPGKVDNLILMSPLVKKIKNYPGKLFSRLLEIYKRPAGSEDSSIVDLGKIVWKYLLRAPLVLRQTALLPNLSFLNKELFTVKTKTIFLWGEKDTTCPIKDYELIKSSFPNHKLVKMMNVGHGWTTNSALLGRYFEPLLARCFFKD